MTDWEQAFAATGWSPGGASAPAAVASPPATAAPAGGSDWERAFAAAGWSPGPAGPAGAAAGALGAAAGAVGRGLRAAGTGVDKYLDLAREVGARHGLDPSLLAGVWDFESSGNPGAINRSSGATGLGQVMPREAGFPDRPTKQELLDPATNAEWSARILKSGLQRYGSEDKALAAYLGAIDARGNITGAVDANGTGGNQYIRTVRERQQRYRGAGDATTGTTAPSPSTGSAAPAGGTDWERAFAAAGWTAPSGGARAAAPTVGPQTGVGGGSRSALPEGVSAATGRQAIAASWALSQLGSKAYYDACQRFIELAYGTSGRFRSAAQAGQTLFKTADPAQADVGDLVFFKPDASNGYAGHAAINLGNGEMVGATYGGVTRDNYLTNPYWRNLLLGFGDPPDQWTGRASDASVARGAQSLTNQLATTAASGATDSAWEQAFRTAGFRF